MCSDQVSVEVWVLLVKDVGSRGWLFGPDVGGGYDRSIVVTDDRFGGKHVAPTVGEVQGAVSARPRRWYELF